MLNAEVVRSPFKVPIDAALPWPSTDEGGELRLACVARLHPPSKGQDILFDVLAEAPWNARKWILSLYGEGQNREVLMRLAERLGLGPRVKFVGQVADVSSIWADHHVLVLPSRYEGLPVALVEAMLCARPAVVTDVGGNTEVLTEGVTGFVAEAPTLLSFRAALERMWQRRADLKSIGRTAAEHIHRLVPADPTGIFTEKLMRA